MLSYICYTHNPNIPNETRNIINNNLEFDGLKK